MMRIIVEEHAEGRETRVIAKVDVVSTDTVINYAAVFPFTGAKVDGRLRLHKPDYNGWLPRVQRVLAAIAYNFGLPAQPKSEDP
jgi:hypothetical protein